MTFSLLVGLIVSPAPRSLHSAPVVPAARPRSPLRPNDDGRAPCVRSGWPTTPSTCPWSSARSGCSGSSPPAKNEIKERFRQLVGSVRRHADQNWRYFKWQTKKRHLFGTTPVYKRPRYRDEINNTVKLVPIASNTCRSSSNRFDQTSRRGGETS